MTQPLRMARGFTPQFLHGLTTAEFVDGSPTFSTHQFTNAAHQSVSSGRDGYFARSVLRIYSRILGLCWLPAISRIPNSANATGIYENSSFCCCMAISPNLPSRSTGDRSVDAASVYCQLQRVQHRPHSPVRRVHRVVRRTWPRRAPRDKSLGLGRRRGLPVAGRR